MGKSRLAPEQPKKRRYNALGKRNVAAIERIVASKYSDVRRSTATPLRGCAVLGYLGKWRRCSIE
jgi:hypothetical protein